MYIDLSPWISEGEGNAPEYALSQTLLDGGVGLHPCEEHNGKPGWFRMVFAQERGTLEVGLDR